MLGTGRGLAGFKGVLRSGLALASLVLFLPVACSDDDEKPPPSGDGIPTSGAGFNGGATGTGGKGGSSGGGTGGMGGEGGVPPGGSLAPNVRITSPEHLGHPDDGTVHTEAEVEVLCEVTRSEAEGSEPVGRVTLRMLDADEAELVSKDGIEIEGGQFMAPFFLQDLPNGIVWFECSASDTSADPHVGSDRISTFVDHGPAVEIIRPLEDSAHSLLAPVTIEFTVMPDPLADDDPGSEVDVDSVSLTVLGQVIDLEGEDGRYLATVNLADEALFPDPPENVAVVIAANNVREPARGERVVPYSFKLDTRGPIITVNSPEPAAVVGGEVILRFSVSDDVSNVEESSVFVTLNGGERIPFDLQNRWTHNGVDFSYRFDTTSDLIASSSAQVIVNIGAKDSAGNDAAGASILLYLDNKAPTVDFDPPMVREYVVAQNIRHCSNAFDPVGPGAVNDLDRFSPSVSVVPRALVWERTNPAMFPHYAGVDRESVYIYAQIDPQRPVLISTDTDNECEEIADREHLRPFFKLIAVPPAGSSFYGSSTNEPTGAPAFPGGCTYRADTVAPVALCTPPSSDLTRVLPWDFSSTVPVIYAVPPLDEPACTGLDLELHSTVGIQEGWICIAGRAVDNVGNVGVSRPLRLCYDDGVGAPADCSGTPPTCTDGCTVSSENQFPPNSVLLDPP